MTQNSTPEELRKAVEEWMEAYEYSASYATLAIAAKDIIPALSSRIESLETTLHKAAQTFREYEALHLAKGTEDGSAKAQANAAMAKMCEDALE